jgi:preprotein translocase subunit SecD
MAGWLILLLALMLFGVRGWTDDGGVPAEPAAPGPRLEITFEAQPVEGDTVTAADLEATREVLARRLELLGIADATVSVQGERRIIVNLPPVGDPDRIVGALQTTALLEIIDPQGAFLDGGAEVTTSLGGTAPGPVYTTILSNADVADAALSDDQFGQPMVTITFNEAGAATFFEYTSQHIGKPVSIVLDKVIVSTPVIQAAISNNAIIVGLDAETAEDLVIQLKAGSLPVPMAVVEQREVTGWSPYPAPEPPDATPIATPAPDA